jgi:hypothetical protein
MSTCTICRRDLPNKYAVAGRCEASGCEEVFCALHWHAGNRRCPAHGWSGEQPRGPSDFRAGLTPSALSASPRGTETPEDSMNTPEQERTAEQRIRDWARRNLTAEQARKVMHTTIEVAAKAGHAAQDLVKRLRNVKTPDDMLQAIDDSLAANQAKSRPLAERAETLYKTIAARKKIYEAAPPARKKILELELRNLMAEYKGAERELTAFYDNEHALNVVRGRLLELMAHGMRKLDEGAIDKLTDEIEEAVGEAEGVRDSVRDLDQAGKRRERGSDQESFADALAGFEELPAAETPAADAAVPEAPPAAKPVETKDRRRAEPEAER